MSQTPEEEPDTRSSSRDRSWLQRNVGKIVAGLATFVLAPILVGLVLQQLAQPKVIVGPSPAPSQVVEETAEPTPEPTPEPTDPPPTETDVRFYRPFTDQGLPPYADVTQVTGECFGESMTSADPQALRCSYDGVGESPILDPCWANVERTQVACPKSPWDEEVTLLDPLTDIIEGPDADGGLATPDPEHAPFAIELVTDYGVTYRCTAIAAYAGDVAGYRRNYDCHPFMSDVSFLGYAFGDPDRSRDLWRIRFAETDSTDLAFATVVRVWM